MTKKMRVLDRLMQVINHYLPPMSRVVEPSNATANRHVRVMPGAVKLTQIAKMNPYSPFTPYVAQMEIIISVRLRGGNAGETMTRNAGEISLILAELFKETRVLKDVSETITENSLFQQVANNELRIVGDGYLENAMPTGQGFSNQSTQSDMSEIVDELFTYENQWKANLSLTVHRYFTNSKLKEITFINQDTQDE